MAIVTLYPTQPRDDADDITLIRKVLALDTPENLVRRGWNVQAMRAAIAAADARAASCLRSSVHAGAGKR